MLSRKFYISILLITITSTLTAAQPSSRGLLPEDYYNEVGTLDVALSPHGDLLAFTVVTILEDNNQRHREVWMQRLRAGRPDGDPFRFTNPTEESSAPRWSPDGSILSFQSARGDDSNSTWFVRVTTPGGEAHHVPGVDGTPIWSPDGMWIAYTKKPNRESSNTMETNAPGDRPGWIAPNAISQTVNVERFDGRVITSMRYKRDGRLQLQAHPSIVEATQLFVVSAAGGEPRQLTSLAFDIREVIWSANGERLYFTADAEEDDEYNKDLTVDIYTLAMDGTGQPRRLTSNPGSERGIAISPNGALLAYLSTPARGKKTDLKVVSLGADGRFNGTPRTLTGNWNLTPGTPRWTDNDTLRFEAGIKGSSHLFEVSTQGSLVRQVTTGARRVRGVSTSNDGQTIAYTATTAIMPTEVFVARGDGTSEFRVTRYNEEWLKNITLMPAERLTWIVNDGTEIEGWLIKPVGYQSGNRYPMILKIHGGPHGAYGNTFFRTFHVLSNAGFFVLYTNPRGSTGYGHAFTYATLGQWGEMDSEDYLTGVDAAMQAYPNIDSARLGVSGGSYGGFMTNWLTATTNRFAAAVTSRSITNWESWYGSSNAQGLTDYEFLGPPWEQRELYRRLSPISYVENVTAPTLIIHSENDYRTPIADGEQWFMALMKRQIPVELVRYPRSSHGLSRSGEPWLLVDRLERLRSWFTHWLNNDTTVTGTGHQP